MIRSRTEPVPIDATGPLDRPVRFVVDGEVIEVRTREHLLLLRELIGATPAAEPTETTPTQAPRVKEDHSP